jgi:soluble lytic murein transglycosylase-like protein
MTSATLALLFASVTQQYHLPPGLLSAVCFTESSHRVDAIHRDDGGQDSVGLCQLHLSTAKWLGYKGNIQGLFDPKTNVTYAGTYLAYLLKRYNGNIYKAMGAYNSGHYTEKNPGYIKKVIHYWEKGR